MSLVANSLTDFISKESDLKLLHHSKPNKNGFQPGRSKVEKFQILRQNMEDCATKKGLNCIKSFIKQKLFSNDDKELQRQEKKVSQGVWNYKTTLWHLTINFKSVSKWVSNETILNFHMFCSA